MGRDKKPADHSKSVGSPRLDHNNSLTTNFISKVRTMRLREVTVAYLIS
jgi:hypothetical protein